MAKALTDRNMTKITSSAMIQEFLWKINGHIIPVCFHAIPASSSCMQTAFGIIDKVPESFTRFALKYRIKPKQSQPKTLK